MIGHITRITYFMNIPKELHNYLVHTQELRQNTKGGKEGGGGGWRAPLQNRITPSMYYLRLDLKDVKKEKKNYFIQTENNNKGERQNSIKYSYYYNTIPVEIVQHSHAVPLLFSIEIKTPHTFRTHLERNPPGEKILQPQNSYNNISW